MNYSPMYGMSGMSQDFMNPLLSIQYQHYHESPRKVDSSGYGSSSTTSTVSPPSTSGGSSNKNKGDNLNNGSSGGNNVKTDAWKKMFTCEVCQMSFPTSAVLDSHLIGSRDLCYNTILTYMTSA